MSDAGPCGSCPWLTVNHGKRHPDGWYTKANRDRLWSKLRRGEPMSCHRTDPANPVSEPAQAAGYRPAPEHAQARECAGALILQQREMQHVSDLQADLPAYRKLSPRGLTLDGIQRLLGRLVLGGTPLALAMAKPNLNEPVSHDPLPAWQPRLRSSDE